MVLDPPGTLRLVAFVCVTAGAAWAAAGAASIYLGSTRLSPRIRPGEVWRQWERRRTLWAGGIILSLLGAYLGAEPLGTALGSRDLYWRTRVAEMLLVARLGSLIGYLLVMLVLIAAPLVLRRMRRDGRRCPRSPRAQ
jgi:MFS family permease